MALSDNLIEYVDRAKSAFAGTFTETGTITLESFDGGVGLAFAASSYAQLVGSPRIAGGAFTVIFRLGFADATDLRTVVAQGGSGAGGAGWNIRIADRKVGLTFGGIADYTTTTATLAGNSITTIAVTVSGNGGTCRYYINGVLDSSVAVGTMNLPASTDTLLGARHNGSGYTAALQANDRLAWVMLWNRELSGEEVALVTDPSDVLSTAAKFRIYYHG